MCAMAGAAATGATDTDIVVATVAVVVGKGLFDLVSEVG